MNELMKFRQDLSRQQITSISDVFTLLDSHIERLKTNIQHFSDETSNVVIDGGSGD